MTVPREEIAALLRAGDLTESAIAAKVGVSRPTVHNIRKEYGLPAPLWGSTPKHASIEDAYRANTTTLADGHAAWNGRHARGNVPMAKHRRHEESAYRVAFRIHHGREPQGVVAPACGRPACVAGAHLEDRLIRSAKQAAARAEQPARKRGPAPNGTRTEIVALLGQGLSNRRIGQILRTDSKRVGRIRAELDLPQAKPITETETVEEKWQRQARPVGDGHMEWTGSLREGIPVLAVRGEGFMARRVAFRMAYGRDPEGRVKPGCDMAGCVAPQHMEDARLRAQFNAIFGATA